MATGGALEKKVLDHTSFDAWKAVKNTGLSNNGEWAAYAVDPQEGDGMLYFYNTRNGKKVELARGHPLQPMANGDWL